MPSLIDMRRRIRSVRNTQQITKAMRMVSAAKLRRAQERVVAARPYATLQREMLASVAAAASAESESTHPLLAQREPKRVTIILITSDKGLAGAFNANVIRGAQALASGHAAVDFELVGRKGRDFFRRRSAAIGGEYVGLLARTVNYADAASIAQKVAERFSNQEIDAVYLVYNEFRSVLARRIVESRVLPVELPPDASRTDYIYEQPAAQILETLLPRYVEVEIYRAMLESNASEHAARMTAMEAATKNATEMIDKLTLHMNRVRQASITKEIIEVVSGAAAAE